MLASRAFIIAMCLMMAVFEAAMYVKTYVYHLGNDFNIFGGMIHLYVGDLNHPCLEFKVRLPGFEPGF